MWYWRGRAGGLRRRWRRRRRKVKKEEGLRNENE
jgi:hypothetical protein